MFFLHVYQHQEQVLNDTLDGREIYNTIRRKTKDAFYKNIVKKGYLLKKSELCLLLWQFFLKKIADMYHKISKVGREP